MLLDRIDLNLFVVFDTIYTERNLTRAAEVLCLTQPAVSNALSRLRNTLNDDLFVRHPNGMMPTPVADNIIVRVREALLLLSETISDAEQFDASKSDKVFRVSMTDFAQSLLLPELMVQLQQLAPEMAVKSYYVPRHDQSRAMASGQLDLAIDFPLLGDKQLQHKPVLSSNYVCVMSSDHLVRKEDLTIERYLQLQHLHISSRQQGLGQVDASLHKKGLSRSIQLRVANYLLVPHILNNSKLIATVPAPLARKFNLVPLPLPFDVPPLELHLYWHKNVDRDAANSWFRGLVCNLSALS